MTKPAAMVAAAVLALSAPLGASAIVAIRMPQRVVLGADSLTIRRGAERRQLDTCKLRRAGPWFYVIGGYEGHDGDPLGSVDVFGLITRAVAPARSMRDALLAVQGAWRGSIRDGFVRAFPAVGAELTDGGLAWEVVVGGLDHGVPSLGVLYVVLVGRTPPTFLDFTAVCPGGCGDGRMFVGASVSGSGPAVRLVQPPRPAWVERGDVAAVQRLILMQAAATPELVGPPVRIVEITAAGARWIGERCEALP